MKQSKALKQFLTKQSHVVCVCDYLSYEMHHAVQKNTTFHKVQ